MAPVWLGARNRRYGQGIDLMYRQHAFYDDAGARVPFDLVVTDPIRFDPATDEYYCQIDAPGLFAQTKRIHGEGAGQAAALAVRFINDRLAEQPIFDAAGLRISAIDPNTLSPDGLPDDSRR